MRTYIFELQFSRGMMDIQILLKKQGFNISGKCLLSFWSLQHSHLFLLRRFEDIEKSFQTALSELVRILPGRLRTGQHEREEGAHAPLSAPSGGTHPLQCHTCLL